MKLEKGKTYQLTRTFTKEEVKKFSELAQYVGRHHEVENEEGELMIQGLLTATMPTWLGGEYDIIVYHMDFDFVKGVYTGDTITCEMVVEEMWEKKHTHVKIPFTCKNQRQEVVFTGYMQGTLFEE